MRRAQLFLTFFLIDIVIYVFIVIWNIIDYVNHNKNMIVTVEGKVVVMVYTVLLLAWCIYFVFLTALFWKMGQVYSSSILELNKS